MTSFLIWRELLPGSKSRPVFPIPPCDMLLPLDYAQWNSSKGGSDTVTRFCWNCLNVLPIRTPQTVVVARLFMLYAVLLHRTRHVVTGNKKINMDTDTIQSTREQNNQRIAFHQTLK